MNIKETEKDAQSVSKVGYQFTAIPTKLMCLCDVNVRSALFTLIQISSEYADADGWFVTIPFSTYPSKTSAAPS